MTGKNVITRSLRLLGAVQAGEAISSDELADGLTALNAMINAWAAQRLTMYAEIPTLFTLNALQQDYAIGAGGDVNVARPIYIPRVSVVTTTNGQALELALKILSTQQWQEQYPLKSTASTLPTAVYINWNTAAFVTLSFFPVPNAASLQGKVYLPTAITAFTDGDTDYALPPGYEDALTYGLALRIAPEYGRDIPPAVAAIAAETLMVVKRSNIRQEELRVDHALVARGSGAYNWLNDTGA